MVGFSRGWALLLGAVFLILGCSMVIIGGETKNGRPRVGAAAEDWQTRAAGAVSVICGALFLQSGMTKPKP